MIDDPSIVTKTIDALKSVETKELLTEQIKYGKTPVVYLPTRGMLKEPPKKGLMNLILNATSEKEISSLIEIGKKYDKVSNSTIRKWERTAKKRIAELRK